jgi:hypothetical protein
LDKHLEREATKTLACKKKEAQMVVGKISPLLIAVESVMTGPEFGMLTAALREPLEMKKAFLVENLAAANSILGSEVGEELPEIAPLAEIVDALATAKKIVARITNVLAAIARLHH